MGAADAVGIDVLEGVGGAVSEAEAEGDVRADAAGVPETLWSAVGLGDAEALGVGLGGAERELVGRLLRLAMGEDETREEALAPALTEVVALTLLLTLWVLLERLLALDEGDIVSLEEVTGEGEGGVEPLPDQDAVPEVVADS